MMRLHFFLGISKFVRVLGPEEFSATLLLPLKKLMQVKYNVFYLILTYNRLLIICLPGSLIVVQCIDLLS